MIRTLHCTTPFGWVSVEIHHDVLQAVRWSEAPASLNIDTVLFDYMNMLLKGEPVVCPWSIVLQGTPFQRAVWTALTTIPFGETRSYSDIAKQVGSPRASQAVGQACKRNPLPLVIPCHRVVRVSNGLGGYCGIVNSDLKMRLLANEKKSVEFYRPC